MKIEYEERKCVCCKTVNVNALLVDITDEKEGKFIICLSCANNVYNFMSKIKEVRWHGQEVQN